MRSLSAVTPRDGAAGRNSDHGVADAVGNRGDAFGQTGVAERLAADGPLAERRSGRCEQRQACVAGEPAVVANPVQVRKGADDRARPSLRNRLCGSGHREVAAGTCGPRPGAVGGHVEQVKLAGESQARQVRRATDPVDCFVLLECFGQCRPGPIRRPRRRGRGAPLWLWVRIDRRSGP